MIGFYGDIIFESNDKRILTFQGFQRETQSRWAKHDVIGRKPASEFIGPDLDTVSFTVNLNGNYGVKPREEMERWLRKCRSGTVEVLVIGTRVLGVDKWKVSSVSQMWNVVMNRGEVFSGSVDIELEEYVEELR
ncbi:phage tail protein [Bacillus solitudinis]|uniref:phage tail protein n=1 Tax=Bacillus solitudinis TaxID=2014074 RepID=UPI000C233146|nr:phage tail protein [Bacillus solitudinis]